MLYELTTRYGLSRTRSQFIIGKKGRAGRFTKEDIIYALQLRVISTKAFTFVRNSRRDALPALSTLRNWIRDHP